MNRRKLVYKSILNSNVFFSNYLVSIKNTKLKITTKVMIRLNYYIFQYYNTIRKIDFITNQFKVNYYIFKIKKKVF